jgi:hypothetical protein
MKFNFSVGIFLLMVGNSISGVEAQTTNSSPCGWVKSCSIALNKKELSGSISPSTSLEAAKSPNQLPVGKVSTVAELTAVPQQNLGIIKRSDNFISQITPPTDSNGNRIFRSTRSGPSYFGGGANFGLTGGSDLGGTSFAVISKLGLTETISVRPNVLILRDFATILLPVTYDFAPQQPFGDFQFSPYLGGGVAINTGSNSIGVWKKLKQKMDERHIKRCPNIGHEKSKH